MWLSRANKDTISMSDSQSFSTDPLLSIIKILSTTEEKGKYMTLPNQTRLIENNFSWLKLLSAIFHYF